jgi:hypothetical protein
MLWRRNVMRASLTISVLVAALLTAETYVRSRPARATVPVGQPVEAIFSEGLVDGGGRAVNPGGLKGKVVGVYFSANWSPPCRLFSPQLMEFRDANRTGFEVVLVSLDNSEKDQMAHMREVGMK